MNNYLIGFLLLHAFLLFILLIHFLFNTIRYYRMHGVRFKDSRWMNQVTRYRIFMSQSIFSFCLALIGEAVSFLLLWLGDAFN